MRSVIRRAFIIYAVIARKPAVKPAYAREIRFDIRRKISVRHKGRRNERIAVGIIFVAACGKGNFRIFQNVADFYDIELPLSKLARCFVIVDMLFNGHRHKIRTHSHGCAFKRTREIVGRIISIAEIKGFLLKRLLNFLRRFRQVDFQKRTAIIRVKDIFRTVVEPVFAKRHAEIIRPGCDLDIADIIWRGASSRPDKVIRIGQSRLNGIRPHVFNA